VTPGFVKRLGVMGWTAMRHPAARIGGIESVGHMGNPSVGRAAIA